MARLRRHWIVQLIALLSVAWAAPALAQEPVAAGPAGLYKRPTLVLDPGMHTAQISRADVDGAGRYAVTGSHDKTVRVWSVEDGRLLRTIRLPAGPGRVGRVDAVAISPDGELIAAGGWTRDPPEDEQIYIFNRATGGMMGRIEGLPNVVLHLTFSPDGRYLAATLSGGGLRVYDRHLGGFEVARKTDYADPISRSTAGWRRPASMATSGCMIAGSSFSRRRERPADSSPWASPSTPTGLSLLPVTLTPRRLTFLTGARWRHCRVLTPTGLTEAISARIPRLS